MTGNRQSFGEEIRHVMKAAYEKDTEVSLADPVPDPVQAHVRGLGHALRDGVGRDADGHLVVTKEGGGWLGGFKCGGGVGGGDRSVIGGLGCGGQH